MGMLLNEIMAKGATLEEVCSLLDAAFHVDRFNPTIRPKFPSKQKNNYCCRQRKKKDKKTVNISSHASVVAR